MTLRELLKKPFWAPKDLSLAMQISVSTARTKIMMIRRELAEQGFINLTKSKAPTKVVVERLGIDVEWLERNGGLDYDLTKNREKEVK